jgi:HlyD family secretion protein
MAEWDVRSRLMDNASDKGSVSAANPTWTAFEQLDTLVRVTTVQGWIYLAVLFAVGAGAIAFAVLYPVPTKVNGEGFLLTERDALVRVRARATGRLVALEAPPGTCVDAGEVIGMIAQEEQEDRIREAEAQLADLYYQDGELSAFEETERASKNAAIARLTDTVVKAHRDAEVKLEIAGRVKVGADRLRAAKLLDDLELLESREKFYDVRDALNKGDSRLAELELEAVTAENARKRAQIERRLKIGALETRLRLDRDKLERTSEVVSPACGEVAQVLSAGGGLVQEGAPVVLLHAPRSDRGADEAGPPYDAIVFVSAGDGKRIETDDAVEVVPSTVKREEHGFIHGRVVAIAELPATKLAMEAALEHPELVEAFLKRYAPGVVLRLHIKLEEQDHGAPRRPDRGRSARQNPFRWSSSSGPTQPLKTGTMCQAAIVVERRPLIRLILPWSRKLVGAD